jgi:hypothetical protein
VLAVDNKQYRHWVKDRWGIELSGPEAFHAIGALLDSKVEYRRIVFDAGAAADSVLGLVPHADRRRGA